MRSLNAPGILIPGILALTPAMAIAADQGAPPAAPQGAPQTVPGIDQAAAAQATSTEEVLDVSIDRAQKMTIPIVIDGQGPFDFLVDTGAQATVVTQRVIDRLGLQPTGRAMVVGMASREIVETVDLDGLELGERTVDNLNSPLLLSHHISADGILGLDSLQGLRVLIDFREETIAVDDAAALGGNRGYDIVVRARRKLGQLIITRARIDGVRTAVVIDTGAYFSTGNAALRAKLRSRSSHKTTVTDVNGKTIRGDVVYAKELRLDGVRLSQVPITFAEAPPFAALGLSKKPALILGLRDLRGFERVAIDFDRRQIMFDVPRSAWGL